MSLSIALLSGLLLSRVAKKVKLPAVTAYLIAGVLIGPFVLGAIGIPGIGKIAYDALSAGDIPFIMGYNMFLATLSVIGILMSDVMYAIVDPRVKLE